MKRSKQIRLVLIGGISAGTLGGCTGKPSVSTTDVYTNNYYVPGVGYYHAPFRAFYAMPYNHFDPQTQLYFFGGQWGAGMMESITNVSSPTQETAQLAEARRTDISRGGFGGTHGGSHYWVGG